MNGVKRARVGTLRSQEAPPAVKQEDADSLTIQKEIKSESKIGVKREKMTGVKRKLKAEVRVKAEVKTDEIAGETPRDFPWRVLQVVHAIPFGYVAAYGQCAALAGAPRNARQVGKFLSQGLFGEAPWQRVLNSSGAITLPTSAGRERQRVLLLSEGVAFRSNGKVEPASFWRPSQAEKDQLFC
jgi:methylated-DNA-protein-cysteine methyltransferase-like protein